jgi:transcription elongation factor GreA-like protein
MNTTELRKIAEAAIDPRSPSWVKHYSLFQNTFNPTKILKMLDEREKMLAVVEAAKKQRSKDHPLYKALAQLEGEKP